MRHLHKRHKYDLVVMLAVIALGISLFLAISHYLGIAVPCDVTHGCETVLTSKYASLLGLPLSVWGVAFFTGVIVSALMANHYKQWRRILTGILGIGALCSVIFLSLQFFAIKSICQYCLTTDLITIILLLWDLNVEHIIPLE